MVIYTDIHDHFCGKCHEIIKTGERYVLTEHYYEMPCGKMRRRETPMHEKCATPEEKLNGILK